MGNVTIKIDEDLLESYAQLEAQAAAGSSATILILILLALCVIYLFYVLFDIEKFFKKREQQLESEKKDELQ